MTRATAVAGCCRREPVLDQALCAILGTQCNFRELVPLWGSSATSLSTHLLNLWEPFPRRSAYCAASVASLTNILTPALFAGTAEWIAR